ncbi:MAG: hypothetical protein J6A63_04560 [Clostridia bacterium]|nr:hypothetical protein [Clostridia bacterium]
MSKRNTVKKTAAILLALTATVGATGCNFIVTDNVKDLAQIVATVDISSQLNQTGNEFKDYADDIKQLIQKDWLSSEIPKRDLIAAFLSVGITYVQSYGYTYKDTFNLLMDDLINQKLLTQYAVAYKLSQGGVTFDGCKTYVEGEIQAADKTMKALYESNPEYLTLKYFLTEGKNDAESMRAYNEAVYSLQYSLNSSLDSAESNYITAEEDAHTHENTRTTPTNVNAELTDYYPISGTVIEYDVYTGRNDVEDCGAYEAQKGSKPTTRLKAYNTFLSNLQGYGLIKENENTADVTKLDYYYMELASILGQKLVSEYAEDLENNAIENFSSAEVQAEYDRILSGQQDKYSGNATAFDTALDGLSDTSFVLYGHEKYGFVYNILLPFSASQNLDYTAAKNKFGSNQEAIYKARRQILTGIEATDLRNAWFCADNEDENYAYATTDYYGAAAENPAEKYLFFENNMTNSEKYESLGQYLGKYPYQGSVTLKDGEYEFDKKKFTIDTFMKEMEGYINYAVGDTVAIPKTDAGDDKVYVNGYNSVYGDDSLYIDTVTKKTNYEKFVYYQGKVNLTNTKASEYFYKGSAETEDVNDSYAAISAVNELMFAFSTDTGCLNTYMGYAVAADKTDFVSEFEYAAQKAVLGGVGTYVVVPSDYGWHIIYCSFVYDNGEVYGGYNDGEKAKEGTFSNLFYESMKSNAATNAATNMQNKVKNNYQQSAVRHTAAYQDLLDLDK